MGKLNFKATGIEGLYLIEPKLFGDSRGYFMETWNQKEFEEMGLPTLFVQDNQSCSSRGVLRGLHFQKKYPQGKLVRVIHGSVYDVAVDLRPDSPTKYKSFGTVLSAENHCQMFVPAGFAHGFMVLTDTCEFVYKCSELYHPEDESGLLWNDPALGIDWPLDLLKEAGLENPILSDKDQKWKRIDQEKNS